MANMSVQPFQSIFSFSEVQDQSMRDCLDRLNSGPSTLSNYARSVVRMESVADRVPLDPNEIEQWRATTQRVHDLFDQRVDFVDLQSQQVTQQKIHSYVRKNERIENDFHSIFKIFSKVLAEPLLLEKANKKIEERREKKLDQLFDKVGKELTTQYEKSLGGQTQPGDSIYQEFTALKREGAFFIRQGQPLPEPLEQAYSKAVEIWKATNHSSRAVPGIRKPEDASKAESLTQIEANLNRLTPDLEDFDTLAECYGNMAKIFRTYQETDLSFAVSLLKSVSLRGNPVTLEKFDRIISCEWEKFYQEWKPEGLLERGYLLSVFDALSDFGNRLTQLHKDFYVFQSLPQDTEIDEDDPQDIHAFYGDITSKIRHEMIKVLLEKAKESMDSLFLQACYYRDNEPTNFVLCKNRLEEIHTTLLKNERELYTTPNEALPPDLAALLSQARDFYQDCVKKIEV